MNWGRVVIPKEIRRTLRIREGDPLELFTERDELMLKKYSPIASIEQFRARHRQIAERAERLSRRHLRYGRRAAGERAGQKGAFRQSRLRPHGGSHARAAQLSCEQGGGRRHPAIANESELPVTAQVIVPVVAGGDCLGAVVLLATDEGAVMEALRRQDGAADVRYHRGGSSNKSGAPCPK